MLKWSALMRGLVSRSADLLGPPDARCLVCGERRRGKPAGTPDGLRLGDWLCAGCLMCIPWIRRPVCPRCGRAVFCPDCVRQPVRAFEMNRSAVRYSEDMKKWLALYKFRGDERFGGLLAEMLVPAYERLTAEVSALAPGESRVSVSEARFANRRSPSGGHASSRGPASFFGLPGRIWHAVTYAPASRERAEERGFNQAERFARAVAMRADAPVLGLIRRLRDGGKQSQRGRAERLRAMRAVFGPDEAGIRQLARMAARAGHKHEEPLRILLVDDIYTTGATAEACAEAIRGASPCPVRIYVLTWARS